MQEKNILHIVNLDNVGKETINIHVKKLQGSNGIKTFKVLSTENIKKFIDEKLF